MKNSVSEYRPQVLWQLKRVGRLFVEAVAVGTAAPLVILILTQTVRLAHWIINAPTMVPGHYDGSGPLEPSWAMSFASIGGSVGGLILSVTLGFKFWVDKK